MSRVQTLQLSGTLHPEQEKTYPLIPFNVPEGVTRLNVAYHYANAIGSDPHLTGGNTVDIGIFDPRGSAFMGVGFRGWSGSARREFYIGLDEATPGYMPGKIQAGIWHICLGAYKVAEDGCDYEITIDMALGDTASDAVFPARLQLSDTPRPDAVRKNGWYRGELHNHTHHSDGDSSVEEVVRLAELLGLDFLAITDHNVLSQQVVLRDIGTSLMLIPGMEVTTYQGHWNVWGDGDWIDFRVRSEDDMQRAIDQALRQGYVISCNHPRPYGPEWAYPEISGFDSIEVWNGPWELFNGQALAYWEAKLNAGERYTAVGGSDNHFLKRDHIAKLAHPTLYIYCAGTPSPAKLLTNLRAGRAFISESPEGPELYLYSGEAMTGAKVTAGPEESITLNLHAVRAQDTILQLWGNGEILRDLEIDTDDWQHDISLEAGDLRYVRAQITNVDGNEVRALTNPIYVRRRPNE